MPRFITANDTQANTICFRCRSKILAAINLKMIDTWKQLCHNVVDIRHGLQSTGHRTTRTTTWQIIILLYEISEQLFGKQHN
jgi:hypothetical protein